MTLKRMLESLDGLSDELKGFYKEVEGKFILQVDGANAETPESVTALKNAKEHEKNLRVSAEGERDTIKAQLTTAQEQVGTLTTERDAARAEKGTDVAALETSWQAKVEAEKAARTKTETELTAEIERLLVTNTANSMAHEISTVPELFSDTIARRLKVEKGADGKYFTRVLDAAGTPSAKTLDELREELLANEKYAAIIISGKGSGGGAGGPGSGGGAGEKKWLEYTDEELVELRRTDKAKYDRLKAAHEAPKA